MVRPLLEYATQVWSCNAINNLKLVEQVQRRATRYIMSDYHSSYEARLASLKLLPLSYRREILDLTMLFKGLTGANCLSPLDHLSIAPERCRRHHKGLTFSSQYSTVALNPPNIFSITV